MSEQPRPRGRPKGTGIDDRATLNALVVRLAADPALRPTTAIKQAGIFDPSVVRRLRDKLKSVPAVSPPPEATANKRRTKDHARRPIASAQPIKATRSSTESATPASEPPQQQDTADAAPPAATREPAAPIPPQQAAAAAPLADPQLEAMRLAAEAAGAMSRLYLHCVTFAAQTNPLSLALRSQTVMSQWITGMLTAQMPAPPRQAD